MNRGLIAEIDLPALQHNLSILKNIVNERPVIAVVKADAYGHGAPEIAKSLLAGGVSMLAVAFTGEARVLRQAGITAPILVLFDRSDPGEYFDLRLTPVIQDLAAARRFSEEAERRAGRLQVHLKIDTGMGRMGFQPGEAVSAAAGISDMKGLEIAGLMSHFSEADLGDRSFAENQIKSFRKIRQEISDRLGRPLVCHIANSAAALFLKDAFFDAVRPGLLLWGGYSPFSEQYGLRPLMKIRTKILALRAFSAGMPVSYGRTFVTSRPSLIAAVPAGYADGYSRRFSNNAEMLVRGTRVPVAGRVCMDITMADVTDVPGVAEGDEVVLLGRQGDQAVSACDLAARAGTIPYEILTSLGTRAHKEYLR